MRLSDTLAAWYGSAEVADLVLGGGLGSVDRTLRCIRSAPGWSRRSRVDLGTPPQGLSPDLSARGALMPCVDTAPAPTKPPHCGRRRGELMEVGSSMVALANNPDGVTSPEVARLIDLPLTQVGSRFCALVLRGHVVKVKAPRELVRHFAQRSDAQAWAASRPGAVVSAPIRPSQKEIAAAPAPALAWVQPEPAQLPEKPKRGRGGIGPAPPPLPGSLVKAAAGPGKHAPTAAQKAWVSGHPPAQRGAPTEAEEVVIPANVKRTEAKPMRFDPRYQVDPDSQFEGAGFSRMGIGRYHP